MTFLKHIIVCLCSLMLLCPSTCDAARKQPQPPIRSWFDTWNRNRATYNAYRDSVFEKSSRDEWVNLCIRRSASYRSMYNENQAALDAMHKHFARPDVPKADYDTLFDMCMYNAKGVDVFMATDIMQILLNHYEGLQKPSASERMSLLVSLYCLSSFNFQISNIGDTVSAKLTYPYIKKAVNLGFEPWITERKDYQIRMILIWGAYTIMYPQFVKDKIIDNFTGMDLIRKMRNTLDKPEWRWIFDFLNSDDPEKYKHDVHKGTFNADDQAFIRRYMNEIETYTAYEWDDQNMRNWANGRISADSTYAIIEHSTRLDTIYNISAIKNGGMKSALDPLINMVTLLPFTSYSKEQRTAKVHEFYDYFLKILRLSKGDNDIRNIRAIENFATDKRAIDYLTTEERLTMLNDLMMAAQINTFAHSSHLAEIAQTLIKGIIKYDPKLLVGIPGCPDVSTVKAKSDSLISYIWQAAMFHDLGKNSMAPLITNDFRKMYDSEYQIIKQHPEKGLHFLDIDPSFSIYHDTTLGHHKWYDGKGGYPTWFNNTKSDVNIMIDVVTLGDCLEAATDAVGRNYNPSKVFETVLQEFESGAGVRYNPYIVKIIRENEDLYKELDQLVSPLGCYANYYEIYKEFFRNELN